MVTFLNSHVKYLLINNQIYEYFMYYNIIFHKKNIQII